MAGLEGLDATRMDLVDALGAVRWDYDEVDRVARPVLRHADRMPLAVNDAESGERVVVKARFGLPLGGGRIITNARDDKLLSARTWKALFGQPEHHALAALSYVVERDQASGTTYRVQRRDGGLMVVPALAAVRHWHFSSTGNEYDDLGHVQVTSHPNAFIGRIHDRFVIELPDAEARDAWMDPEDRSPEDLLDLLVHAPNERYELVPISPDVWSRRDDPAAVAPRGEPVVWRGPGVRGEQTRLF